MVEASCEACKCNHMTMDCYNSYKYGSIAKRPNGDPVTVGCCDGRDIHEMWGLVIKLFFSNCHNWTVIKQSSQYMKTISNNCSGVLLKKDSWTFFLWIRFSSVTKSDKSFLFKVNIGITISNKVCILILFVFWQLVEIY